MFNKNPSVAATLSDAFIEKRRERNKMAVTLRDVAAAAGVSLPTVSKVLNNKPDVASTTVDLVEKALREVGYQRPAIRRGRPPSSQSAQYRHVAASIALLFLTKTSSSGQTPLIGQLIDGIETVAREGGFHLLVTRLFPGGGLPLCLDPVQVDGLIVRSPSGGMETTLPKVPTVWIFRPGFGSVPGDLVAPDDAMYAEIGSNYLLKRGHQQVAMVNWRPHHPEAHTRSEHFVRFMEAAGANVFSIVSDRLTADEVVSELLAHTPRITGIFLPLGLLFVEQLYLALQRRGVRCGEDIDLISSNEYMRSLDPRLFTIDIQLHELGRVAAETLLWRIQHPKEHRRSILIEPQLIEPGLTMTSSMR